ncbi:MAG: transglycosylase domain-containing protein, partial [Clostridia bacterium]|nr:transglycosylase domain-containing protein [Clostridia bacterium]
MRIIGKIFKFLLFLLLAACLVGLGYYFAVTHKETLRPEKLLLHEQTVEVYDYAGARIENVSAVAFKQTVAFSELPKHTVAAFIDTEDKRFFSHGGFDYKRIAKAVLNNLRSLSFKEGASTISQQLIKNTHLSQEKTLKRKLKEWKLTRQLEKKYSKEEIFEKYVNTIYFGHSCFGLRSATEFYFGKNPSELTLGESAVLAGLVKSPNRYSPFKNAEKCEKRKRSVLALMEKNGSISAAQKQAATDEPLPEKPQTGEYAGYLQLVFDELSTLSERQDFTVGGNIKIHTFLDPALQSETEKLANSAPDCDRAVFALDTETLGFKACVSTIGNVKRLPGSLIKPLLVYAPA